MKDMGRDWLDPGVYAITPDIDDLDVLLNLIRAALDGGIRLIQYRNKCSSSSKRADMAEAINELVAAHHAYLIINDDVALAKVIGAAGVHVGKDDESLARAREILGPEKIIGVSCYDQLSTALEMQRCGADYVAFGSFFKSSSKPSAKIVPADILLDASACGLDIPVVAIGGITLENAPDLLDRGANMLAIINGIFGVSDVTRVSSEWVVLMQRYRTNRNN
jgi:thiamine-phosphate pyrophosphorylase